jgi:hypothetical protein
MRSIIGFNVALRQAIDGKSRHVRPSGPRRRELTVIIEPTAPSPQSGQGSPTDTATSTDASTTDATSTAK